MTTPRHFMDNRQFLTNDQVQKEYATQRKDRMHDAIDDYLNDDRVSGKQAYEEFLSCVDDVIEYHKNAYCRAMSLRDSMTGESVLNLQHRIPDRY